MRPDELLIRERAVCQEAIRGREQEEDRVCDAREGDERRTPNPRSCGRRHGCGAKRKGRASVDSTTLSDRNVQAEAAPGLLRTCPGTGGLHFGRSRPAPRQDISVRRDAIATTWESPDRRIARTSAVSTRKANRRPLLGPGSPLSDRNTSATVRHKAETPERCTVARSEPDHYRCG